MDVFLETSNGKKFEIEIWFFSTVREIKEKIQKYQGYPISDQKLFFNGQELADDRDTEYYDILQNSCIHLKLLGDQEETAAAADPPTPMNAQAGDLQTSQTTTRPPAATATATAAAALPASPVQTTTTTPPAPLVAPQQASSSKRLKLVVLTKCGTRKIPVEVNAMDNVSELRKELQKLQGQLNFHLPSEGYFFIYKQNVMEEDRTFRWHDMKQGDTIEMFNGSVTGGS